MRFYAKTEYLIVLGIIFAVGFGCNKFRLEKYSETPEEPKKTVITKEILSERFNTMLAKTPNQLPSGKPNPLTLQLTFSNNNKDFFLNQEYFENFGALANSLKQIFKDREENGIFIEGTNETYKKITLPAYQKKIDEYNSKNIFVEDFEKLVDDLRMEGFNQIEFDINEENQIPEIPTIRELPRIKPPTDLKSDQPKKEIPKTISGGVLNGKAIDLAKPPYPNAARAARASGAVNVQVTVDENGDVVSAKSVSGHPLLRTAAESAARSSKFNPTMLSGQKVKVTGVIVYNFKPE